MSDARPEEQVAWKDHIADGAPLHPEIALRSVQSWLDDAADKFGSRPAISFQNLVISYAKLKEMAEKFAASLRELGLQDGDRVAIMMPNLPQTIIAFWGTLKAGATNDIYQASGTVNITIASRILNNRFLFMTNFSSSSYIFYEKYSPETLYNNETLLF